MIHASMGAASSPSAKNAARSMTTPPSPSGRARRMTTARMAPSVSGASLEVLAAIGPPRRADAHQASAGPRKPRVSPPYPIAVLLVWARYGRASGPTPPCRRPQSTPLLRERTAPALRRTGHDDRHREVVQRREGLRFHRARRRLEG